MSLAPRPPGAPVQTADPQCARDRAAHRRRAVLDRLLDPRLGPVLGVLLLGLLVGPVALLVQNDWAPLLAVDDAVTRSAEDAVRNVPGLLGAARAVTLLGDPRLMTGLILLAAAVALGARRPRVALCLLAARAGAVLLSTSIKQAVDRERPVFADPVDAVGGMAFPSGHALGSAACWLCAAVVAFPLLPAGARRAAVAGAVAVAVLVSASRVLLGVHYLSDAAGGLVLGLGWALVCLLAFRLWPRP